MSKFEKIIFLFLEWLDGQLPAQCPVCKKWQQRKIMRFARHHVAGMIQICPDCHKEIYQPDYDH